MTDPAAGLRHAVKMTGEAYDGSVAGWVHITSQGHRSRRPRSWRTSIVGRKMVCKNWAVDPRMQRDRLAQRGSHDNRARATWQSRYAWLASAPPVALVIRCVDS